MRFIIGLVLGLGIGLAAALLLAPEKRQRREGEPFSEEESGAREPGDDHDVLVSIRQAMQRVQEQVQEAWEEARQAAHEAEEEMRGRYERSVPKPKR
jgi:hypothetical protein